jgi:hypothetical protein
VRRLAIVASVVLAVVVLLACVASEPREYKYDVVEKMKPRGIHEDCFQLEAGQKITCLFESTLPLDFNIHYHEDSEIFYAVEKEGVSSDDDVFEAPVNQYYCLMWTNPNLRRVTLNYEYKPID